MICRPESLTSAFKLNQKLIVEYRKNPNKLVFSYCINILTLAYYYYYCNTTHTHTHPHTTIPNAHIALSETILTSRSRTEYLSLNLIFTIGILGVSFIAHYYTILYVYDYTQYISWCRPRPYQRSMIITHPRNA